MRAWLTAAAAFFAAAASAMPEIPKASAKALGVTRGRPFSSGLVFVEGKYVDPPYVVERWGTGIRINGRQATGQVINWNEFLKTQDGVKVSKSEPEPAPPAPEPAAPPPAAEEDSDDTSLDDLFDDDPKPKKKAAAANRAPRSAAPPKPKVTVSYTLEGEFVPNAASKALVARINALRTEIERVLRTGGFICFGENYSRVTGDQRSAQKLLERLPELQRRSDSLEAFLAGVRAAGFVYLNEPLCEELFRNRLDFLRMQERRSRMKRDEDWNRMLEDVSQPLL
ncbi:MAG: hypothetical protein J6T51_01380 [Kiritimatiellae bacterium]|nr:hypothetical protein [Kiritimatiellia bacterium]